MKKFVLLFVALFAVLALSACGEICVGPECLGEVTGGTVDDNDDNDNNDTGDTGITVDNVIPFTHINGHGEETEKLAFILFEVEVRDYVKYQVSYLSCTCRDKVVNYWNVMYIEINKYTQDVRTLTFGPDGDDGHYTPGTWGDSSGDPNQNGVTFEMFEDQFIPWVVGKSLADLEGISVFDNDGHLGVVNTSTIAEQDLIDTFAGSSVSTNNMIRVVKELLEYHAVNYD